MNQESESELTALRARMQEWEKENQQLKADCAVKDEALRELRGYINKFREQLLSDTYSRREMTTLVELADKALLTNPGAKLLEEIAEAKKTLLAIREHCEGDICGNRQDITIIHGLAKNAMQRKEGLG